MLTAIYYLLMLLLGFAWYKFGQNLLRKGYRDERGERTEGFVGPVGFLVTVNERAAREKPSTMSGRSRGAFH